MISQRTTSNPNTLFWMAVLLVVTVFVFGIVSISEKFRQISPQQPKPIVTNISASTLIVSVRVIDTVCEDIEKIDYSVVELTIDGGTPPYELTITNSESELFGPYLIMNNDLPVKVKVYGGDFFTAGALSKIGEIWSGIIGLPSEDEFCKAVTTPTLEPTATPDDTATPFPTDTETIVLDSSVTVTATAITSLPSTKTRVPGSTNVATQIGTKTAIQSTQSTATHSVQVTNTPPVQVTATHPVQITNTLPIQYTATILPTITSKLPATPTPLPTITPIPLATATPLPQPTPIPTVINPNPRECEDGEDNDKDGYIDYGTGPTNDPDCKKPSDPHEDK